MSVTLKIDVENPVYIYNRIITYEYISFGTGIHCMFKPDNRQIVEFIKNHSYNELLLKSLDSIYEFYN